MPLLQAVSIGLIVLILTPGALFYFDVTPKLAVLLAATAVLLPFAAARAPRRSFPLLVWLYAGSLILSASLSLHPGLSWFGSSWRRFGTVTQLSLLLFVWVAAAAGDRRAMLRAIAIATSVAALYGIAQYAGFDPFLPAAGYHVGEGVWTIVRPPSTFGYVSYFATWLAMAAFLALALAAREKGAWRRVAQITAALACAAALLTGSRAALLGLAAGAGLWLYHRGFRLPRRAIAIAGGVLLIVGAFYFSPAGLQMRSRTRWFIEDPWGGARLTLWRDSLRMGLARPIVGYGPEVFTAEFPRYESVALAQAYPDFAHESPHNIFLDALISQGVPGLVLFAALVVIGLRITLRAGHPGFAAAFVAGLLSQQFTVFTIPAALLTCLAAVLAIEPSAAPLHRWRAWVMAPVTLALLYCAIRYTVADAVLARAQHSLQTGDLRGAADQYARYSRWRFPGTSADLWYSRAVFALSARIPDPAQRIQAVVQSGVAALQAPATVEDPFDAWYNLAQMSAARNDAAAAERALRAAIAAKPQWFKPHWTLARLLFLQARGDEAKREAALAIQLDAGKHPEVKSTLQPILPSQLFQ
jgi:O-antigen ligase